MSKNSKIVTTLAIVGAAAIAVAATGYVLWKKKIITCPCFDADGDDDICGCGCGSSVSDCSCGCGDVSPDKACCSGISNGDDMCGCGDVSCDDSSCCECEDAPAADIEGSDDISE